MSQFRMIPANTKIPFIANHKPVLWTLFALSIASLVLAFVMGPNWGTSFQGGTSITIHFDKPVETERVREEFVIDPRFESVSVQQIGNEADNRYVIRTRTTTTLNCTKLENVKNALQADIDVASNNILAIENWPVCNAEKEDGIRGDFFVSFKAKEGMTAPETPVAAEAVQTSMAKAELAAIVSYDESANRYLVKPTGIQSEVLDLMMSKFADSFNPETGLDQIDSVGADVGEKFRTDAIVSILVALALMLLYIGVRFDTRYAPAAVISLAVSTLVTFGVVIVLQMEITLETVAAFLSLVGYGINDTIVTFDRVRENVQLTEPGVKLDDIVNKAINDCLSRTAITSITTLIAIIPMCILATGATQDFAIIMTIGICVTTFDSIFVSCPMFLKFDAVFKGIAKRNAERREYEELNASAKAEIDV